MSTASDIADRVALARNRARATEALLHDLAAEDLQDRLSLVNRSFTAPAIVSPAPATWTRIWPEATCVPDTDTLDLEYGAHDLVMHAMALHWAADPVGQLVQARRALRPDGLFLGIFPGGQTLGELRAALAQAESDVTGGLSPRVLPMTDVRDAGSLLQRAGFAMPVADSHLRRFSYATPLHLMRELRAMGEGNALAGRLRRPTRRSVLMRAVSLYAQAHGTPDGRIPASFDFICLTGWAPSGDQPQPLRPGSANTRLATALGATETTLPD